MFGMEGDCTGAARAAGGPVLRCPQVATKVSKRLTEMPMPMQAKPAIFYYSFPSATGLEGWNSKRAKG